MAQCKTHFSAETLFFPNTAKSENKNSKEACKENKQCPFTGRRSQMEDLYSGSKTE